MPSAVASILSLSAAGLYLIVLAGCMVAAFTSARYRQPPKHRLIWGLIAIAFLGLAIMRFTALEEIARVALRGLLMAEAAYEDRRVYQRAIVMILFLAVSVLALFGLMRQWQMARGRRNVAVVVALAGLAMMVGLLGLRIISLHDIDKLLYGPLKLNWFLDIGASLAVLGAAAGYVRFVRQRP
jgi:hypothetical protein